MDFYYNDASANFMSMEEEFYNENPLYPDMMDQFNEQNGISHHSDLYDILNEEEDKFNKGFEETFLNKQNDTDENIENKSTDGTEKEKVITDVNKNIEESKENNNNEQSFCFVMTEHIKQKSNEKKFINKKTERDEEIKEDDISSINKNGTGENTNIENDEKSNKSSNKKNNKNYSSDIIVKKVRMEVLINIQDFINRKIKLFYNNKIRKGIHILQFLDFDKTELIHSKVNYDKNFLNLKLGDIFSWDLSKKITNYLPNHNRQLVQELISSEKEGEYFKNLFNITFIQCLRHIRDEENIDELNGLNKIDTIFLKFIEDKDYYNNLVENLEKYEKLLFKKKSRKSKKD